MIRVFSLCLMALLSFSASASIQSLLTTKVTVPFLETYAAGSDSVGLNDHNVYGYKVNVDVANNEENADNHAESPDTVSMQIALYTSDTVFFENCSEYKQFSCKNHSNCTNKGITSAKKSLPYYTIDYNTISIPAYLSYNHWSLNTSASLASSCNSNISAYGKNTVGLIGLGTENPHNFQSSKVFSIYLPPSGPGLLLLKKDLDYADKIVTYSYKSNANWHISDVNEIEMSTTKKIPINAKIMFDLNLQYIGLPTAIFNQVFEFLSGNYIKCVTSSIPYICSSTADPADLPTIVFHISGSQSLDMRSEIYITGNRKKSTLNIIPMGSDQTGEAYLTPEYSNYIIFGAPFMKYYYTEFDATNGNGITIYRALKYNERRSVSGHGALFYGLIIVGSLLVIILAACCYRAQSARRISKEMARNQSYIALQKSNYVAPTVRSTTYFY